jgi:hypothetical protein
MRNYKQMVIEWVNTDYQGYEDTQEYKDIMKNINNIVYEVFHEVNDGLALEEEMDLVWCTIEKYKNLEKNKRSEII